MIKSYDPTTAVTKSSPMILMLGNLANTSRFSGINS